jgi:hypothetical protein
MPIARLKGYSSNARKDNMLHILFTEHRLRDDLSIAE